MKYSALWEELTDQECETLAPENAYQERHLFSRLNGQSKALKFFRGNELTAVFPGVVDFDSRGVKSSPLSYGQGMLYSRKFLERSVSKVASEPEHINECFVEWLLANNFLSLNLDLAYSQQDCRPWQWVLGKNKLPFQVQPRYSARIRLQDSSTSTLLGNLRAARRQEIAHFKQNSLSSLEVTRESACSPDILDEYARILTRTGPLGPIAKESLDALQRFTLAQNHFDLWQFTIDGGVSRHFSLVALGKSEVRLMLNFTCEGSRVRGLAAFAVAKLLETYHAAGFEWLDFDGANSKDRGDDKHSFGASPQLFLNIKVDFNV